MGIVAVVGRVLPVGNPIAIVTVEGFHGVQDFLDVCTDLACADLASPSSFDCDLDRVSAFRAERGGAAFVVTGTLMVYARYVFFWHVNDHILAEDVGSNMDGVVDTHDDFFH